MSFLTSCFNQLAASPSFSRLRRIKEKDADQCPQLSTPGLKYSPSSAKASSISPVFSRPRSPFSPAGMSSYDHCDDADESEPLLLSQPSSPNPSPSDTFSKTSSLLSASSLPRPQDMAIVKSASSDNRLGLGVVDDPVEAGTPSALPLLPTIQVQSKFVETGVVTVGLPDYSSSGPKVDFSPNAFQLDKYVSDTSQLLAPSAGSFSTPPVMEDRMTSDAPTAYYTMDSGDHDSIATAIIKTFASPKRSPDKKTMDEHEAYLASLKLLKFGESSSQVPCSLSVMSFTFGVMAETVDDDTASWENVNLSSYGWV